MKHPAPDTIDWNAMFAQANWTLTFGTLLLMAIVRCCIVARTGHPFWLGLIWTIPIIGWFFKLWLATAPWPGVKSAQKKRSKGRPGKKVAA